MAVKNQTAIEAEAEAAFTEAVKKDSLCPVGRAIEEHPAGRVIEAKVADQITYSGAVVARVLKTLGIPPISAKTINDHRKNDCRCR